jgi:hypothetical protein
MLPKVLYAAAVDLAVQRLREMQFPEQRAVQVAYHLGWLNALDALRAALDVPDDARQIPDPR